MSHITGAGRKFKIPPKRLTNPPHTEKRKAKYQRKGHADNNGSIHVPCYYMRSSSSSMTSAQVVTDGKELTATPRLAAISCRRPWNR
jgi:hypothetical protein